jgi:hypothetical protein
VSTPLLCNSTGVQTPRISVALCPMFLKVFSGLSSRQRKVAAPRPSRLPCNRSSKRLARKSAKISGHSVGIFESVLQVNLETP